MLRDIDCEVFPISIETRRYIIFFTLSLLVWPVSFAFLLEYGRRKSCMVIYVRSPIWPLRVAIVCDKLYRFSGSGCIGARVGNVKYSIKFFNIARMPMPGFNSSTILWRRERCEKNCDRHISSVVKKHLELPMPETARPTSAIKPTPY